MTPAIRYPLGCAVAAIALLATSVGVVAWQLRDVSALTIEGVLGSAQSIQRSVAAQHQREMRLKTQLLAEDQAFVGYIGHALASDPSANASVDKASIRDLLEERRAQYGFEQAVILDPQAQLVASTGADLLDVRAVAGIPLAAQVRSKLRPLCEWDDQGNALILACVFPLVRGTAMEAMLLTVESTGTRLARELADSAHVDVALLGLTPDGPVVAASTLRPQLGDRMLALVIDNPGLLKGILRGGEPTRDADFNLGDGQWRARLTRLSASTDDAVLITLLAPSVRKATFAAVAKPACAGIALLLCGLLAGAFIEWRRVRKPLSELTALVERATHGDPHLEAHVPGSGPAARLATAFNRLLAKENRERLSRGGTKPPS